MDVEDTDTTPPAGVTDLVALDFTTTTASFAQAPTMRAHCHGPTGDLLTSDVDTLRRLVAPALGIVSLEGLQACASLTTANLSDNAGLGAGDVVRLDGNPLSATALSTQIPALESRGVQVIRCARPGSAAPEVRRGARHGTLAVSPGPGRMAHDHAALRLREDDRQRRL